MDKKFEKDLQLTVKVGKKAREFNLAEELDINEIDINQQMMRQPRQFAWVSVLGNLATSHLNKLIIKKKSLHAELDTDHRAGREEQDLKITEKIIEADIEGDKQYQDLAAEILDAQLNVGLLQSAVAAFSQRKDMLISVASNLRAQGDTDLHIMKDKTKATLKKRKK